MIFFDFSMETSWSNVCGFLILQFLSSVKNVPPLDTSARGVGAPVAIYYTQIMMKSNW